MQHKPFLEMINKIDKPLIKVTKKKEEAQITNSRNGKRDIVTDHNTMPTNLIT